MLDTEEDQSKIDEKFDELTERGFSPDEIAEMENNAIDGTKIHEKSQPFADKANAELDEDKAVSQRLKDYYSEDDGNTKSKGKMFSKGSLSRKLGFAAAAVGIPSLLAGLAFLPGLLGLFKLENFFENTNASTFLRLNAAFDNRSDKWMKAYIKLRLAEYGGDIKTDNAVFRANRVDTNNPIRDWYTTMRTSKFEADLAKDGIVFESRTTDDGTISKLVVLRIDDKDVLSGISPKDVRDGKITEYINSGKFDGKIDDFFDDLDGSNKQSRARIKTIVNSRTKSWQVFQRRKIRKGLANMTGVSKWRLFETTRDRLDAKKKNLFDKIMVNVLPENRMGKFVACLFGAGDCPSATDPASSDSRNANTLGDASHIAADDSPTEAVNPDQVANPDGTYETATDLTPSSAANEITDAATAAATNAAGEVTEGAAKKELGKQIRDLIGKYLGNPYTKIWSYLKKLAKLDGVLSSNALGKLVVQGRRAQYMAAYASMAIAVSQMKSGDIAGTEGLPAITDEQANGFSSFAETVSTTVALRNSEVNEYMRYFDNAERSEAWMIFGGGKADAITKASAEGEDQGRNAYCDMTDAEKKLQPIYYQCYDDGLNGNNAEEMSKAYNNSIGKLLGPIADAVKAVDDSVFGTVFNWFSGVADGIVDKVVGPILNWVLETTGAGGAIEDIVTTGVVKAMEYAGAGVKYDPTIAGQMNYMMMGGAATAEASARNNGAAATSSYAYLRDYSNKMATDWQKEKDSNTSNWDRYASLSNPKSLASSMLMKLNTSTPGAAINSIANPINGLDNYANVLSGKALAEDTTTPSSVAEWSGLDTYDFPKECFDLDPLKPNYFENATNAPAGVTRDMATLGDSSIFWDAVYANLPGDASQKEAQAAAVYNCVLLDRSVMGGIGYAYGYSDDGGIGGEASSSTATTDNTPSVPVTGKVHAPYNMIFPGCIWDGTQPPEAITDKGKAQLGARELQVLINTKYGQGGLGPSWRCRDRGTKPDAHPTGRAIDSYFNSRKPEELSKGNNAMGWLITNADIFGIEYVKYWRLQWSKSKGYSCAPIQDHWSHIHFQVNWDGALRKTAYFTGAATPKDDTQHINQEICPLL